MFESSFLGSSAAGRAAYQRAIADAVDTLLRALPERAYSGKSPAELAELLAGDPCAADGRPLHSVQREAEAIIAHSIVPSNRRTVAHLHCAPLIPALAAEVLISGLNQSMDSFDQAPAATMIELALARWLCAEAGLPATASGTFTAGGTQSNYMGLLLARDHFLRSRWGWSAQKRGLHVDAGRLRILCSDAAHFTVEKSAAQLGLGTDAVVRVAVDEQFRMCPRDLGRKLIDLEKRKLDAMAIVATAGTTDFGSIDPLPEIAARAQAAGAWVHVDAAYGGALLFSPRYRAKLAGLELADSVAIDFHKLFWQPISCGAFLLRDEAHFDLIELHADYLNPEAHEQRGIPDLVTRSLLTTRRFDALKVWMSLRVLGRVQLGAMIDRTLDLAEVAAAAIAGHPRLELLHQPALGCVVFRFLPRRASTDGDVLQDLIRRRLFDEGAAVIGQTRINGRSCLKLTFLNPSLTDEHVLDLLDAIVVQGVRLDGELA